MKKTQLFILLALCWPFWACWAAVPSHLAVRYQVLAPLGMIEIEAYDLASTLGGQVIERLSAPDFAKLATQDLLVSSAKAPLVRHPGPLGSVGAVL